MVDSYLSPKFGVDFLADLRKRLLQKQSTRIRKRSGKTLPAKILGVTWIFRCTILDVH